MELVRIDQNRWEIPMRGEMRVPGIIYSSSRLLKRGDRQNEPLKQVANVATLPGIVRASFAMPDMHWGYGFPIGGVAAFDLENGVISPGGVGYDINCGVRMIATGLEFSDIRDRVTDIADRLYQEIPCGVGSKGKIRLSPNEIKKVLEKGSLWAVEQGFGDPSDIERTENHGCLLDADPQEVSSRAIERGRQQLGTLGSGNHFLEIQVVEEIYDEDVAKVFGVFRGQVVMMLHSGSRGLGYQVCDDYLSLMSRHVKSLPIKLPDRQLACAMISSGPGQRYLRAMACAANYAWANRQILMALAQEAIESVLGIGPKRLAARMVYDVCHNIAKIEKHRVKEKDILVCVHRKGATRSFGPGHPELPGIYRAAGQPVIIPGDMGTASYLLRGTEKAMEETFGSTCHGAGRVLSRKAAQKAAKGRSIRRELEDRGIQIRWRGRFTLTEEMPDAYKEIGEVVDAVHDSGISSKVAKMRPVCVVKG